MIDQRLHSAISVLYRKCRHALYGKGAEHLVGQYTKAFIRFGVRIGWNGGWVQTVEIADISVVERLRGQRIFTGLVEHLREAYPDHCIYVECVHNERLHAHLYNHALFRPHPTSPLCFITKSAPGCKTSLSDLEVAKETVTG